jgi:polar amino acid transport system ATP-binding protein
MVFQQFNLFPHMSILENLTYGPLNVLHTSKIETQAQAHESTFEDPLHKQLADDFMAKYLNGVDRGLIERDKFIAADRLIPLTAEPAAAATSERDPNTVGKFPNQGVQVG